MGILSYLRTILARFYQLFSLCCDLYTHTQVFLVVMLSQTQNLHILHVSFKVI